MLDPLRVHFDGFELVEADARLLRKRQALPLAPKAGGSAFMLTRFAFSIFDFARVNQRMHNKLFIADGAFAIAGGRNIADEYFRHSAPTA
jgi:phosphatidylserine/phosphatidylglycerophosphate/cardiolipin synthase-like enzyme